ncbi:hypothetical protein [Pseudomonas sp. G(2018)]|uniref:hypothetical protein n=1 Tax=Pseudomonas sp. G(2018) TaxID=2502242 RepID=UPI0021138F20|nr:hypothetical protein [Pseudomonas sp. G(2018)]
MSDSQTRLPVDLAQRFPVLIVANTQEHTDSILPPFFDARVNFAGTREYSWHTPGHTGGTAFMKTAVGRAQTTTRKLSQSVDRIHCDEAWYA